MRLLDNTWIGKWGWLVYFHYVLWASVLYAVVPQFHQGWVFAALSFLPVAAICVGQGRASPKAKTTWRLFALGQLMFAIGDFVAYVLGSANQHFPSTADFFYVATYPFMYLGAALLIERAGEKFRRPWADAFALMVAWGGATMALLLGIGLYSSGVSRASLSVLYPFLDLGLLGLLFALRFGDVLKSNRATVILFAGLSSLLFTDVMYALDQLSSFYAPGGVLDIGWLFYYAALGAVALAPRDQRAFAALEEPEEEGGETDG